jgi:hypothetical protein
MPPWQPSPGILTPLLSSSSEIIFGALAQYDIASDQVSALLHLRVLIPGLCCMAASSLIATTLRHILVDIPRIHQSITAARIAEPTGERIAHVGSANPERPRRQRYGALRSRAAELDGADDRAVTIDAAGAARAVE